MTKHMALPLLLVSVFLFWPFSQALAAYAPPVTVRILHADGTTSMFGVASANQMSGLSLTVADLGSDGTDEIIVGSGLGNEPRVRVLRADGSEIGSFLAYDPSMGVGINVIACGLLGDGATEIITVPQKGGGPQVRVFSSMGEAEGPGFMAYAESFRGGVNLACGDLDGDGADELVTLPGPGGGPHVRVWKRVTDQLKLSKEFFALDANDARGLVGLVHDGVLTVASQRGPSVDLRTYIVQDAISLVDSGSVQIDGTGVAGLYVDDGVKLTTISTGSVYEISTGNATVLTDVSGGVVAEAGTFGSGERMTVLVPTKPLFGGNEAGHSIVVDLSEQRLYAYEDGVLANSFFISSGKYPYHTPVGNHSVLAKLPFVYYAGVNLDGTAWDLGSVPWNLRIYPHVYIHYAYWHNNFGHPMSHGCVNVGLENMKWIYDWANVGDPVEVRE
jgi:hypothetical protein